MKPKPLTDDQRHILRTLDATEGASAARSLYRTWFKTTVGFDAAITERPPYRPPPVDHDYESAILNDQEEDESWWG